MTVELRASAQGLASSFDVALTDMDGVCFKGTSPIPHAAAGIAAARAAGLRFCFLTNNASRTPAEAATHLEQVGGIPAQASDIVTASMAGAAMLATDLPAGSRVLVVGGKGLVEAVEEAGLVAVFSADDTPEAVIQGWGPQVGWAELAEAAYAIGGGARYYATNLDKTLPTERGFAPGNGSLVAAVVSATGALPRSAGKPEPGIFTQAARRAGAGRPLVIGDRLDTDLAGARGADMPGLLVLTGVSTAVDLALAPESQRPSYVAADLRGLTEPQPAPRPQGEWWVCGAARARLDRGAVQVTGSEAHPWIDAVRAVAALAWSRADAGHPLSAAAIPNLAQV